MNNFDISETLATLLVRIKHNPQNSTFACSAAELASQLEDYELSEKIIRSAIKANPDENWLQFRLAQILLLKMDLNGSADIIDKLWNDEIRTKGVIVMRKKIESELQIEDAEKSDIKPSCWETVNRVKPETREKTTLSN